MASTDLLALVRGVIRGGGHGWADGLVLLALGTGTVGVVAFVWWERRAPAPMVPPWFSRNRTFATASLASLLLHVAAFGALFLIEAVAFAWLALVTRPVSPTPPCSRPCS